MPVANAESKHHAAASFAAWVDYFQTRTHWIEELPWQDPYYLLPEEKRAITISLQQFQLGEGSDGSGLYRRAQQLAQRYHDGSYAEAAALFIAEEQRHSDCLGRFMDQQNIPRLQTHWVDRVFRRFRRLAGLELCVRVLVTAEIIAKPFYRALSRATNASLLQAICERILRDEHEHIRFQAATLGRLCRGKGFFFQRAWNGLHACFLMTTAGLVWQQHHRTLRRGGFTAGGFLAACWTEYRQMQHWVDLAMQWSEVILPPSKTGV